MRQHMTGRCATVPVLACLFLGALAASPAAARDGGPPLTEADRQFRQGGMAGGTDRYPSAAATWGERLNPLAAESFGRGYRAGRDDERARASGDSARLGVAWNDTHQGEAYEALERASVELRRALVLIRRQPSLPRVQGALVQAQEALVRTQNALTWLPALPDRSGEQRYPRARGVGPERASGGWEG